MEEMFLTDDEVTTPEPKTPSRFTFQGMDLEELEPSTSINEELLSNDVFYRNRSLRKSKRRSMSLNSPTKVQKAFAQSQSNPHTYLYRSSGTDSSPAWQVNVAHLKSIFDKPPPTGSNIPLRRSLTMAGTCIKQYSDYDLIEVSPM
jgi:hypothetical protein